MYRQFYRIIILILLLNFKPVNVASFEIKIIENINNQIITNVDIENEYNYLVALNVKYKELDKQKMLNYAKESLVKEIIKKNEVIKYFDLTQNSPMVVSFVENLYLNLGIKNEEEFKVYLQSYDLKLKTIYEKITIENIWNQLVYTRYKDQITINKEEIREKLNSKKSEVIQYNISEIFFSARNKEEYKNKLNKIKKSILDDGFDKAALLYSESDSSKNSGALGWINENQLSKVFIKELVLLNVGENTNPINLTGGNIILKINEIKKELKKIDIDKELDKIFKYEQNRQLNNFSTIYYNKVKSKIIDVKN
jgi:peptidyl-prolyl cis-trans isomerase SurA